MSYYNVETWTIRNIAKAFNFRETAKDDSDLKVVIPIFQRGLRWDPARRRAFIDSLEKGYPFGALLFAKQDEMNKYSVVDGLQRGSTVCDFVNNPLGKDNITSIDSRVLDDVREAIFPGSEFIAMNKDIEQEILDYFHEQKQFNKVQMMDLAERIILKFPNEQNMFSLAKKIQSAILPYDDAYRIIQIINGLIPYSCILFSNDGYLILLDNKYFRIDPANLGLKYGGEITCVGLITNVIRGFDEENKNNDIFASLQLSINEILRSIVSLGAKDLLVIHPIAVYYGE